MAVNNLLLVNLGSPDSPRTPDVARYLRQFLTDPYVINVPAPLRYPLVYGWIVPQRAANSAHAYGKIWGADGSPLVKHTREFAAKVAEELGPQWNVQWAMRYGSPSIDSVVQKTGGEDLWVVPLYPQFASSSTQTAIDEVVNALKPAHRQAWFKKDFYDDPLFISAQAQRIQTDIDQYQPDHLLLSFHGLPENHLTQLHPAHCFRSVDCCAQITEANRYCYRAQCMATVAALKSRLRFPADQIAVSFQSRLGRRPWIKPYTDTVIEDLAAKGARRVLVSCPSFVADCLETLEEIQIRLREQFLQAGGEELKLIPALNSTDVWVQNFSKMVRTWAGAEISK